MQLLSPNRFFNLLSPLWWPLLFFFLLHRCLIKRPFYRKQCADYSLAKLDIKPTPLTTESNGKKLRAESGLSGRRPAGVLVALSDLPAALDANDHALLPEPSIPFVLYITALLALWSCLPKAILWLSWPSTYFHTFEYLLMIFFPFFLSAWTSHLPRFISNTTSFSKAFPDHLDWNYFFLPLFFF